MEQERSASEWGAGQRQRRWIVVVGAGLFVVGAFVMPLLPAGAHSVPLCPFRAATGYSCPGCGMTRSCVAMVHGDVWGSLSYHPLGWFMTGMIVASGLRAGGELWLGRALWVSQPEWVKRAERLVTIAGFVFVLLFGGVRLALELAGILTPV